MFCCLHNFPRPRIIADLQRHNSFESIVGKNLKVLLLIPGCTTGGLFLIKSGKRWSQKRKEKCSGEENEEAETNIRIDKYLHG